MLSIVEASKVPVNSEAFENLVEEVSILAADKSNKDAGKLLMYLLQRNEDYIMGAAYGR